MNRTTMAGAVSFTALAVALILGTQVLGVDDSATPWITTVLGFIGVTVTQLVATKSSEDAKEQTNQLNKDLRNGTFERLLRESLEKLANENGVPLEIKSNEQGKEDGENG